MQKSPRYALKTSSAEAGGQARGHEGRGLERGFSPMSASNICITRNVFGVRGGEQGCMIDKKKHVSILQLLGHMTGAS